MLQHAKCQTSDWHQDRLDERQFGKPGKNYYPQTWFHFIGGNVSKPGITADLEAIAAGGFSGIHLFHGQFGGEWPGVSPQIVALSESWDDLIAWTADECERLGLEFTMQNCPGWSYAGGPWIAPDNAMRHLARSRTDVVGGKGAVDVQLPKPEPSTEVWRDYRDLFVIAFPTPDGDHGSRLLPVSATPVDGSVAWEDCLIRDQPLMLPANPVASSGVDIDFGKEVAIRTVELPPINSFSHPWVYDPGIHITVYAVLADTLQRIAQLDVPSGNWQDDQPLTIACRETTTRKLRVEIANKRDIPLSYLHFFTAARQQNWESEAAWTLRDIVRTPFPEQSKSAWLNRSGVVDLTGQMDSTGHLRWDVPPGNWTVLRVGHINTGMKNGPAPLEATGWESNKLNPAGAQANFAGYIGRLIQEDGPLGNGKLDGLLLDSWECKTQTWTEGLDAVFLEKQGYSLLPMLPALFGYVVDEPEYTANFLRDWRVTINDLLVDNFFGEVNQLAKDHRLNVLFETASGDVFPGDILEYFKYADIPMCEFWQPHQDSFVGSEAFKPARPTVSAARVYGKKRVGAEAFTSFSLTWNEHPGFLKDYADLAFSRGISHLVFHTYTHNPRVDFLPPGSSFGSNIGTPFLRLQTWWQHMPKFTDYLARCGYMLEQGRPKSDVLLYLGDEQNHKPPQDLAFPKGYAYDYCNTDVLLNRLAVEDGKLVTPEGIAYQMLWLYDCQRMLPETLEKILDMVNEGAVIVGTPPTGVATLRGGEESKNRVERAVRAIWGMEKQAIRPVGEGRVYAGALAEALHAEGIRPDIVTDDSDLRWLHRQTADADVYFLSVPETKGFKDTILFASQGHVERWDPMTGEIQSVHGSRIAEGTAVPLDMPAGTSLFLVFNKVAKDRDVRTPLSEKRLVDGAWHLQFPEELGNSEALRTDRLVAWKDMPIADECKAFSGTVVYRNHFNVDKGSDTRYEIDLGQVEMIAKVSLNGEDIGTRWAPPYRLDITDALRSGDNELEIAVTSTWFNRLVYDAGLAESMRKTWTIGAPPKDSPLKPYGLLGPVMLWYGSAAE